MKLPLINKKILDAPFVSLHWKDINSNSAWLGLKEAKNSKITICISNGWLIKSDLDLHILAADVNFNDDGSLGEVGNITTIPTVNVLKIKRVKL
jgi:hypothetical protein|tara:strand:- start:5366 stop:5647 length:282 start_codon:yes stop_codon:yes gene_type:complete